MNKKQVQEFLAMVANIRKDIKELQSLVGEAKDLIVALRQHLELQRPLHKSLPKI